MTIVPPSRPKLTRDDAIAKLRSLAVDVTRPVLLGVRGYYRDTMGQPGENDIGVFDDAILLVTPTAFQSWNANTDPSRLYPNVATLKPGVWLYRIGTHNISKDVSRQYEALVQAANVTVSRAPDPPTHPKRWDDTGLFGINIHSGADLSTTSAGCQTIYRPQWKEFIATVKGAMQAAHRRTIEYVLTEGWP